MHGQCKSRCGCVKQAITLASKSPVRKAEVSAMVGVRAFRFFRDPLYSDGPREPEAFAVLGFPHSWV